jgi:hypothetical protein
MGHNVIATSCQVGSQGGDGKPDALCVNCQQERLKVLIMGHSRAVLELLGKGELKVLVKSLPGWRGVMPNKQLELLLARAALSGRLKNLSVNGKAWC